MALMKEPANQPEMVEQEAEPQIDPQTQETVDMFMANGMQIIHNKKVSDGFIKQIKAAENPIPAIADATLRVVDRLEESSGQRSAQLELPYLAQVANALMGEIIQLAELSGLEPLSDEDKYAAYSMAVSKYLDKAVKSGKISPEQLQQMGEQAGQTPQGQEITQQMSAGPGNMPGGPNNIPGGPGGNVPGLPPTGV